MTIIEADVFDQTFMKMTEDQITSALSNGNLRFASLCTKYEIVSASIATPAPYTPYRIGIVCVLIDAFTPLIGTDFREVSSGFQIDTYKVKIDGLKKELDELLTSFTPEMCGYDTDDDDTNNLTSNTTITWARQ